MVAADHDRRAHPSRRDEVVDREPRRGTIAVPQPADTRRQPLVGNPAGRQRQPALEQRVVREELLERRVDHVDVGRVAREHRPAERPDAAAEQRADVGRHEPRIREGLAQPAGESLPAEVVAVVEDVTAELRELHHRPHVRDDRLARALHVPLRVAGPERGGFLEGHLGRDVTGERIVGSRLVGDQIEMLATRRKLGEDVGRVAEHADGHRATFGSSRPYARKSVVERRRQLVQIPRLEASLDTRRVDLDTEARRSRQGGGEGLGSTHAAEPGGQHRPAAEIG